MRGDQPSTANERRNVPPAALALPWSSGRDLYSNSEVSKDGASLATLLADLLARMAELPVRLSDVQLAMFATYGGELLAWNERVNLTTITDTQDIAIRHFLDSLSLLLVLPDASCPCNLLDVGSGAGFPGVPLAIACPGWSVTLLEATGKKVRFLEHLVAALNLSNVHVVAGRAEEVARDPRYRGRYDAVTARGLAALPVLLEYCAPFCRPGGLIVAPKKGDVAGEVAQGHRAAALLGATIRAVQPVSLPGLADDRVLVVVEQQRLAPAIYPRPAGVPRKRPLGAARTQEGSQ